SSIVLARSFWGLSGYGRSSSPSPMVAALNPPPSGRREGQRLASIAPARRRCRAKRRGRRPMSERTMTPEVRSMSEDEFRAHLRAFLDENVAPTKSAYRDRMERGRVWARLLDDDGLAAPTWPVADGGMDLPIPLLVIYHEEMARSRAPSRVDASLGMVAQSIVAFGTEAQKAQFLPRIRRADDIWRQGFSEPGAGSDLPSLTTPAGPHR